MQKLMITHDDDLGRLDKNDMYRLLSESFLVISIPESDSSPRSVYESIFSGCCVAVTYNQWIESLPQCMKNRLFIVDLDDPLWLEKAFEFAKKCVLVPYVPSEEALEMFDQRKSIGKVIEKLYLNF